MMSDRFAKLSKIPDQPAARLLSMANARLLTKPGTAVTASIPDLLAALEANGNDLHALIDMMRVLGAALPPRERVWWACLAARDMIGDGAKLPPPLAAAEAWVFKPTDENRDAARVAIDHAEPDDVTVNVGNAALFCDGKLGVGDMAQHDAPAGLAEISAFLQNLEALGLKEWTEKHSYANLLIDRALDIARGGNGRVEQKARTKDDAAEPMKET